MHSLKVGFEQCNVDIQGKSKKEKEKKHKPKQLNKKDDGSIGWKRLAEVFLT